VTTGEDKVEEEKNVDISGINGIQFFSKAY
jgi:hypothetical protein